MIELLACSLIIYDKSNVKYSDSKVVSIHLY